MAALAAAAGPPPPQFGRSVDIGLVSGVVVVKPLHASEFRLGLQDRTIPVGSVIDTTHGEVDLRTAYATSSGVNRVQDGQFAGGRFTIRQRPSDRGLSQLDLATPGNATATCNARAKPRNTPNIRNTRNTRVSSRVLATLHASAHGAFRTRGHYSAATVRGTAWDTVDRCDGTLTRVRRGSVSVRDFVHHHTVTVTAGHSYLARVP
jgi:hypothetical protein